jgi:hypothetical protein
MLGFSFQVEERSFFNEENKVAKLPSRRESALALGEEPSLMQSMYFFEYQRFTCNEQSDSHSIKMSRLASNPIKLEKRRLELEKELEEAGIDCPHREKQEHWTALLSPGTFFVRLITMRFMSRQPFISM